jgi:hypothetical protein
MAKNRQKRPDRPRRPTRELPAPLDLDYIEVEEGQEVEAQEPEKELLFTWKGKDYFMVQPEPTAVMDILEAAAERSDIGAMGYLLKLAIGPENWKVLKSIPNLKNEELSQVFNRAMEFTMGSIGELGN